MRQVCRMLDQSPYVNQLVCAVGGVLDFIAKSKWRGGEQKKLEKLEFDMPTYTYTYNTFIIRIHIHIHSS